MATVAGNQTLEFFHLLPCVFIQGWKGRRVSLLFISVINWYSTGAKCAVNNKNQIWQKDLRSLPNA